jgi:hypothetical protein
MSLFATPNVVTQAKTADYTVLSTDDLVIFTLTTAATATLPSTSQQFGGLVLANRTGGQGTVFIQNVAASTASVTIAAGSGDAIFGPSVVAPGQLVKLVSNGSGTWYGELFGTTAGSPGTQVSVTPLTSANILALNATPITLVPAPGTGKCTFVNRIAMKMVTTATGYANGGALEFRYTNASGTKVTADIAAAVVTAGAGTSFTSVGGIEASLTGVTNAVICVSNATAPYITGTGSAVIVTEYIVSV